MCTNVFNIKYILSINLRGFYLNFKMLTTFYYNNLKKKTFVIMSNLK